MFSKLVRTRRVAVAVAVAGATLLMAPAMSASGSVAAGSQPATAISIDQHVEIPAGDHTVPGTFTRPKAGGAGGKYPTVLLLHGTASSKDEVGDMYKRLATKLAARGYASLRIDFAGSGDSRQPETALTFTGEVADSRAALDWLSSEHNVNPGALGLVGFSQGGRVAAVVAGVDSRVKALTTWSTWIEDGSTAYLQFGEDAYQTAKVTGQVTVDLGFRTWTYSLNYFDSLKASHPLADIANYHGPLLGVDGSDDYLWPQTKEELFAAGSLDSTLHVVPGADHIYHVLDADQTQAEDAMNTTAAWFAATLAPSIRNGH
jgi:uncharacterized protein